MATGVGVGQVHGPIGVFVHEGGGPLEVRPVQLRELHGCRGPASRNVVAQMQGCRGHVGPDVAVAHDGLTAISYGATEDSTEVS